MRQHSDKEYADLLSNVRVGKLTDKQFGLLTERLLTPGRRASVSTICHKYNSLVADGHFPLILLPRTNLCDEINTAMLAQLGTQAHMLTAIDTLDTVVTSQMMKKVQQAYQKSDDDVTRTAGLEKHLQLCIGCKVMLKRNMNVDAGLVNRSVGTVVALNMSTQHNRVNSVAVKFDKMNTVVNTQCRTRVGIF